MDDETHHLVGSEIRVTTNSKKSRKGKIRAIFEIGESESWLVLSEGKKIYGIPLRLIDEVEFFKIKKLKEQSNEDVMVR